MSTPAAIRSDPPRGPRCLNMVRNCSLLRITSSSGKRGNRPSARVDRTLRRGLGGLARGSPGTGGAGVGTSTAPGVSDSDCDAVPAVGIGGIVGRFIGSIGDSAAEVSPVGSPAGSVVDRSGAVGVSPAASVIAGGSRDERPRRHLGRAGTRGSADHWRIAGPA